LLVDVFVNPLTGDHPTPDWQLTRAGGSDETRAKALWLDEQRNMLYAATTGSLLVWHNANVAGNHAAAREITFADLWVLGVTGDAAHDRLYVTGMLVQGGAWVVAVLDGGSARNGATTADRVITGATDGTAAAYDPGRDRLYLGKGAAVAIVNNASAVNGAVAPTLVSGDQTGIQSGLVALRLFPEFDLLFVAEGSSNLIVFEKASTLTGNAACTQRATIGQWLTAMTAWQES
jgi:hypothetical protein